MRGCDGKLNENRKNEAKRGAKKAERVKLSVKKKVRGSGKLKTRN